MSTLITYGTSGGDRRRCDESCYNATGAVCVCICGGMCHGKGLLGAQEAMRENLRSLLSDEEAGRLRLVRPEGGLFGERESVKERAEKKAEAKRRQLDLLV